MFSLPPGSQPVCVGVLDDEENAVGSRSLFPLLVVDCPRPLAPQNREALEDSVIRQRYCLPLTAYTLNLAKRHPFYDVGGGGCGVLVAMVFF